MAQKCAICKNSVKTTFLNKAIGTYVKGKVVCSDCQKKYKEKVKEMVK